MGDLSDFGARLAGASVIKPATFYEKGWATHIWNI
jgi:hypothetical protein